MESLQQTVDRAKAVLAQTKAEGSKPFAGSSYETALSSTNLSPTPIGTIVSPTPSTATTGLTAYIQSLTDSFSKGAAQDAATASQTRDTSLQAYLKGLTETPGELAYQDTAYKKDVDPAKEKLNDINNQIIAESVALERRLEALDKNQQGLFGGALEAEKEKVRRESLRKQADLSVIQLASQQKYSSAKEIADRAVAAQMEARSKALEALRINYENNKDLFNKADQRSFEVMYQDRANKIAQETYEERARFDQLIRQNDPLYKAQVANAQNPGIDPSGLTPYQQTQSFINLSNKYQADPIITNALKGQTAIQIANQVLSDPSSATNQLKSLYTLVKNLDPDSAVREGEVALAQQTQSYFDTWQTSLTRITQGQVISPTAAKNLAQATIDLASAWSTSANSRQQQYISQAEVAGVGEQFGTYLSGFNSNFTAPEGSSIDATSQLDTMLQDQPEGERSWFGKFLNVFGL